MPDLKPLSARSVVLSLALGSHPEPLSTAALVRAGAHVGIPSSTIRVALTRATAAGDLSRSTAGYAVGERHLARQHRQAEAVEDSETDWGGEWEMAVVVAGGRSGPERAALRELLTESRLAELREGVWMRPANLRRPAAYAAEPVLATFRSRPGGDAAALAAGLWDLVDWAARGRRLVELLEATGEPAARLVAAAGLVRHLTTDPLLPRALLPDDWPGADLRVAYAAYQSELRSYW